MFKAHNQVAQERLLFDSTRCEACMREYFTHGKLQAHLRHADSCREQLWGRKKFCRPVGGWGSRVDRALQQSHDGVLPPLRAAGPQLPPVRGDPIPLHDLETAERIYMAVLDLEDKQQIKAAIVNALVDTPITWGRCQATLAYLLHELTDQDIEALAIADFDIKHFLQSLQSVHAWDFLVRYEQGDGVESTLPTTADFEQMCSEGSMKGSERAPFWRVHRPMAKERFIIHAFSGRRRAGDFQHYVDLAQQQYPDMIIHTISVDIMVNQEWGDVARPEVRRFWVNAVKARYVVGAFAGPPCETWSQARGRPATSRQPGDHGTHHGPRIVRTCEELWGRASMALREVLQVDTGNLLLMFTLELLIHLAIQGGVGGLEHPAPPSDPSLASIWRLPLLSFLMSWPEFNFIEVSQGLWGAPSRKPTGLLLLNLHRMIPVLRQWQLASEIPKGTSIGVNEAGFWATSYLKEYPPAFCGGLAGGFLASLHEHKVDETMHIDGNFWQRALSMVVNTMGACAGPDFAN